MAYETKDGEGILFFNSKKTGKQPDRRGSFKLNGVEYDIAGWNRTNNNGTTFTRLVVKVKQAEQAV